MALFCTGLFVFNNQKVEAIGYGPGDVLINEFTVEGTQWVELLNTTENDIDFDSGNWNFIVTAMGPGGSTSTLMSKIPKRGINLCYVVAYHYRDVDGGLFGNKYLYGFLWLWF